MAGEQRFAVVKKKLAAAGYVLVQVRGSHHIFARPGSLPLSIPVHKGKVKPYYVRQIEMLIG
jgi:predicted RNA binding protein YcfA (HicA-like mRNA interferase family)